MFFVLKRLESVVNILNYQGKPFGMYFKESFFELMLKALSYDKMANEIYC